MQLQKLGNTIVFPSSNKHLSRYHVTKINNHRCYKDQKEVKLKLQYLILGLIKSATKVNVFQYLVLLIVIHFMHLPKKEALFL